MKLGVRAGFVCAELFIIGLAAVYSLGGVFGYGPSTPDMGVVIFLIGQVVGALPATILGAVLGGFGGFLFAKFPDTLAKTGGVWWGVLYALSIYLLLAGVLSLFLGRYFTRDYEFFSVLFGYIASPSRPSPEFLLSYLGAWILYLCAGAWVGSKLEKLAQEPGQTIRESQA
jgi:hypothetical protein